MDVEVVDDVAVRFVVLDQLADHEGGDGVGDPFTSVNACR